MKCSCCGKDILPYERYCNHCGENNENYIDGYQEPVLTSDKTVNQTIERVQIYPNQLPKEDKEAFA